MFQINILFKGVEGFYFPVHVMTVDFDNWYSKWSIIVYASANQMVCQDTLNAMYPALQTGPDKSESYRW